MDSNIVMTQITLSTLLSGVLAYLKAKAWIPWFSKHSATINHLFLLASSAGTAIGVHAVWNHEAGSLTITGLSLITIAHGIWEWAKSWSMQYLIQRGAFGPVATPGDAPPVTTIPVKSADVKP